MVLVCVYAAAHRAGSGRQFLGAAVVVLALGWLLYGLPAREEELFVAVPATLVSILLALWAGYVISTEPSEEDVLLNVAEAIAAMETDPN